MSSRDPARLVLGWILASAAAGVVRVAQGASRKTATRVEPERRIHGLVQMSQVPGSRVWRLGVLSAMRHALDHGVFQVRQDMAVLLST